jgi:hypothetical protein
MGTTSVSSDDLSGEVPKPEPRPIFLRGYAEPEFVEKPNTRTPPDRPSAYTVIFDCEITHDEVQRLRFGAYQVRFGGVLREQGIFYDPDALDEEGVELEALYFERPHGQKLRTVQSFVEDIFFDIGYATDATIVGFNLPFDISRLAIGAHSAKAVGRKDDLTHRQMR